jgi:hypothetical protein
MLLVMMGLLYGVLTPAAWAQPSIDDLLEGEDTPPTTDTIPPQRIGVPAIEMVLGPGQSGTATGYCFDEYLIAPRRVTRFQNVLAGNSDAIVRTADGKTSTLSDAIASGAVAVRAHQLDVSFINRTGARMQVELRKPTVLWDRPAGAVNPAALSALKGSDGGDESIQNQVWRITTGERRLNLLGYDKGSMWDYNAERLRNAAIAFQKENALPETGQLDPQTTSQLARLDEGLRKRLRTIGFRDREGRSIKEDLGAQIRAFEKYVGASPTGQWSPDLAARLNTSEAIISQLNGLKSDGSDATSNPAVLTSLNYSKGFLALVETPNGVELWSRRGSTLHFEGRDKAAIRSMDDAAAALATRATKGDRVVIYPRVGSGDMATVMVGRQNVEVAAKALDTYLKGGAMPAELATALAPMISAPSTPTGGSITNNSKVVIYNGPFAADRAGAGLARLGLSQPDGTEIAKSLDRTYGDRITLFTSSDLRTGAERFTGAMGSLLRNGSTLFADASFAR